MSPSRSGKKRALPAVGIAVLVLAALVLVFRTLSAGPNQTDTTRSRIFDIPTSIASDCSKDVAAELNQFLTRVPDGSTVQLAAGGCYAQSRPVRLDDKKNVTLDGRGAALQNRALNDGRVNSPNLLLLRGRNLTVKNLALIGNFQLQGPRSQARVNASSVEQPSTGNQFNAGLSIYGGDGIQITDVRAARVFGDGLLTARSEYVENSPPFETPRNVRVVRFEATSVARHCFAPTNVIGFWLIDSVGRDCWYHGVDAELDSVTHKLQDVHLIGNTFDGFFAVGVAFPVAGDGDNTRDYEILNNRFLTTPDASQCNPIILINAYPSNPNTTKNVVVERNSMKAGGTAIIFDHVVGGSIRNNRIEPITGVGPGACGPAVSPVRVTNSSGVRVEGNG
ncbi:MAG: hypothetical protein M3198_19615 [Actinomycetota bacterium]|nr:hypothetical protein [Actinomycetota bacterium]